MPEYSSIFNSDTTVYENYEVTNVIPYKFLLVGLFLAVGVFMTALAWNFAIVETIKYLFFNDDKSNQKFSGKAVIVGWIYTLGLTALLLIVLFIFRKKVPGDSFDHDETISIMQIA